MVGVGLLFSLELKETFIITPLSSGVAIGWEMQSGFRSHLLSQATVTFSCCISLLEAPSDM